LFYTSFLVAPLSPAGCNFKPPIVSRMTLSFRITCFAALAALALPFFSRAQDDAERRCTSMELLQQRLTADPTLAERMQQQEKVIQKWIADHPGGERTIITIPVVVHLVYNPAENIVIPDWQVKSQIDVLNEDYRRLNADIYKTPTDFTSVAGDCEIQFRLAEQDPNGNPTNGIVRNETNAQSLWDMGGFQMWQNDAWDTQKYLNIWVASIDDNILGWSTFPGSSGGVDGVVITDRAFGRTGDLKPKYNRGRTPTHEVGHWFDLLHTWADDGGTCSGSDYCDDTPNQGDSNVGCPSYPQTASCSNTGDMFMNYMDYVHDSCMNIFTNDQKTRMHAAINTQRTALLTSNGAVQPATYANDIEVTDILYPFLTIDERFILPKVRVHNNGSNPVNSFKLHFGFFNQDIHEIDYTFTLAAGLDTVLELPQTKDSLGYNFFIAYATNLNGNAFEEDTVNNYMTRSYYVDPALVKPIDEFTVFNNPSNGLFILDFDVLVTNGFEMDVFDILGRRVPFTVTNPLYNRLELSLQHPTPGMYFVRVKNDNKRIAKKIVVGS
jgi:hypothetical protein